MAYSDWQGDYTLLITATREQLGAMELMKVRSRYFNSCVVLRPKSRALMARALKSALSLQGGFSDWEGFLVGLDILCSGGVKKTFRQYSRKDAYTCVSFVAQCYGMKNPYTVLPNDFISSTLFETR